MSNIIGFDFSINKPAVCIFDGSKYNFMSWPFGLSKNNIELYKSSNVNIIERTDIKNSSSNSSVKMRWEIQNSKYLAQLISNDLQPYIDNKTIIAFEGLSFNSGGNIGTQLAGYKYILMNELKKYMSLDKMYTYAPQTIKSVAGCAGKDPITKKKRTKADMINEFIKQGINSEFRDFLSAYKDEFKTRSGNWITHLDDLVDAYFAVQAYIIKG